MKSARDQLTAILHEALAKQECDLVSFTLEHPTQHAHGDFATNAAMIAAQQKNQNPHELATKIVHSILEKKHELLDKVEIAGPGFINFFLSKKYFVDRVSTIRKEGESYGKSHIGKGRTAIVEFSSPNIAKPFTIGHLRSTIIGDAIARLLSFSGYSVLRDNHLGDWGTQFGKQIVALKLWGDEDALAKSENPVKYLVDLYVKFHAEAEKDPTLEDQARAWFVRLEQGDPEAKRIWKMCVDWSMAQFAKLYELLHVSFDMMLGESFFEDKMGEVLQELQNKGLAKESEGALLVFFENEKYPPFMVRKKDGATLYSTRDLATDRYRVQTWGKDVLIVNEVGAEQTLYFRQLFEVEEKLGYVKKSQRVHVGHGMLRFKDGKMSTRKGNTIWLEDVLQEAIQRASSFNPKVAKEVGIGALKYNDLKRESSKDVVFVWDDVLNLKGNSGPYIQYTYARATSVLKKAKEKELSISEKYDRLQDLEITQVEHLLEQFPEVVERAATEYAPHHVCTYLFDLAQAFNAYYADHPILSGGDLAGYRLLLTSAVAQVLKNGLTLLGMQAPEVM
ncbi:MAG: arginine--tRNA ligase [Candidatus Pacebacteria bacterium]|nr:arginine--tRNA ligase [Candidatus Paceibacterota bacterium]